MDFTANFIINIELLIFMAIYKFIKGNTSLSREKHIEFCLSHLFQGLSMHVFILMLMLFLSSTSSFATENNMSDTQPKVKLTTSVGEIIIQLNAEKAPVSVENFLTYVKEGHYEGTIFHRVIPGFMAQGGGFDTDFNQKSVHDPIKNEADNGLKNTRGTLAMARTNVPDSATSQFFINYKNNESLNHTSPTPNGWGYAVFAEVVEGMDIVDEMSKAPTGNRGMHQDVPKVDIIIEKVEIIEE
jgi:peptidyl-prolyl cis-trans isomerase B (cyclophilin B)